MGIFDFVEACKSELSKLWKEVCEYSESKKDYLDKQEINNLIREILTSGTKSYHYVPLTQILSKFTKNDLDSHSLQASYDKPGAFDARTIAHKVIVPFDKSNYNVLGGSTEPYVNNPLRCSAITLDFIDRQRNKNDWKRLISLFDYTESLKTKKDLEILLKQILLEIFRQLSTVQVVYPTPNRVSMANTKTVVGEYLNSRSGGDRLEIVVTALFRTIAERFAIFDEVKREKINAADATSGMIADIECYKDGKLILITEVKDQKLTITQIDSKLDNARHRKISEILFVAEKGIEENDKYSINEKVTTEFSSGQNIYVQNFIIFSEGILVLLGESGRSLFLENIGCELDRVNSNINNKKAWANILKTI